MISLAALPCLLAGLLAGACLPVQTCVNTRLGSYLGSPLRVSLASFAVGLACLCLLAAVTEGATPIPWDALATAPPWIWIGGLMGMVFLTGNILLFPRMGGTQTVILPVFGQILMGMAIDALGLFRTTPITPGLTGAAGAALVFAGVVLVSSGHADERPVTGSLPDCALWSLRLFAVVAGCLSACQTAINGQLTLLIASPLKAAAVSFMVGSACLACLVAATWKAASRLPRQGFSPRPPWIWTGGVLGATCVLACAWLAPIVGTGLTVVLTLGGSTAGGLVIDHFGLLGARRRPVTTMKILGVTVMVAGAALVRLR